MSRLICLFSLASVTLSLAFLSGCGQSASGVDPVLLAKHQARLILTEEPDGAQVVPEVRNALLGITDDHEGHDHDDHDHADHDDHDHADHDSDEDEHEEHEHDEDAADGDDEDGDDEDGDDEEGDDEDEEDDDSDHAEHDHADHADHEEHDHDHADHDEEHGHEDHDNEGHDHEHTLVVKATEPMEVVLVGQIGGLTNPWQETQPDFPFARNQAAFFLADPQSVTENAESGHQHAPGEECAFCAAHAADRSSMLAMVRFLDENGNVLRMDVRDLFDVKETDTVVLRGTARVIEGGMMVVEATGLYVRR